LPIGGTDQFRGKPPWRRSLGHGVARFREETGGGQKYPSLGPADDALDADGLTALSFEQAQKKAQEWFQLVARHPQQAQRLHGGGLHCQVA